MLLTLSYLASMASAADAPGVDVNQEPPFPEEEEFEVTQTTRIDPVEKDVSVLVSPLHLAAPMLEVTGEFRTGDTSSLALIGGLGSDQGTMLWEIGGQASAYFIGDFDRGINVGAEVTFSNTEFLARETEIDDEIQENELVRTLDGGRLAFGPYLGGKYTFDAVPITLELQGGANMFFDEGDLQFGPLVNVLAGVSF